MKTFTELIIFLTFFILCIWGKNFDDLISRADIYYYSPVRNSVQTSEKINSLPEFKSNNELKLIIHGYIASKDHTSVAPILNAYLALGYDSVFVADWTEASFIPYYDSRYFVRPIALQLTKKLKAFMSKNNIPPSKVHIIGHSLGAHIAGNMGDYFNGSLGRVTGLDPAYPLFNEFSKDDLRASAAQFVDVIHSGAQLLGDFTRRGHIDFYPNYGYIPQPGCDVLDIITFASCSHFRVAHFYGESILLPENFPSVPCPIENIRLKRADKCFKGNHSVIFMGEKVLRTARGNYYLETRNVPPYGFGQYSMASHY